MRLVAVAVVALVLTAGCVGLDASDGRSATPASPTPGVCETDLLLTDAGTEAVTPKPAPDPPSSLSAESAGQFAQSYERAFAHNHELGNRVQSIAVELQGATVRSVDGGYRVRVHVWTRVTVGPVPERSTAVAESAGNATTSESFYDAHYFVSESVLRRAETERHGTLPDADLSESGVTLACWRE